MLIELIKECESLEEMRMVVKTTIKALPEERAVEEIALALGTLSVRVEELEDFITRNFK